MGEYSFDFLSWCVESAKLRSPCAPFLRVVGEIAVDVPTGEYLTGASLQWAEEVGIGFVERRQFGARKRIVEIENIASDPIGKLRYEIMLLRVESDERVLEQLVAESAILAKGQHLHALSISNYF